MKYLILLSIFLFTGCSSSPINNFEKDSTFPKVQDSKNFEQTVFIPSLETTFDHSKNGIYAASLLMAWDEIKRELSPIQNISSPVLKFLNQSKTYQDVLNKEEYISSILIEDHVITAKAFFKKSLPFEYPLRSFENELKFKGIKVPSFGFFGSCPFAEIAYYKDDNDFAIKLSPKDQQHEIILMKSRFKDESSLLKYIAELEEKEIAFNKEKRNRHDWKYYFNDEDEVKIPCLEFNIGHDYEEIMGSTFESSTIPFSILQAYQRTAFVLNEKGAEVESEATVTTTDAVFDEDLPKPKKMFFDKDFLILLKRKDKKYPYFGMLVVTTELMKK
jgi:hypothetical protein